MTKKQNSFTSGSDLDYNLQGDFYLTEHLNALSLPSAQGWDHFTSGSATIDIQTLNDLKLYKEPIADFIRFNDDTDSGFCSIFKDMTSVDWENIDNYGANIHFLFIMDSVNGINGSSVSLKCKAFDNPLNNGNRGYHIDFYSEDGFLKIDASGETYIMNGTLKNPVIKTGTIIEINLIIPNNISSSEKTAILFINGRKTNVRISFDSIAGSVETGIEYSSGSPVSSQRISFLKFINVYTGYVSTPILFDFLLKQDGSRLLLQNNNKIIIE